MWNALITELSKTLHCNLAISNKIQLSNSGDDLLYKLSDNKQSFFVKVASKDKLDNFEQERIGLNTLTKESTFYVADSLLVGQSNEFAYHVIEWLDLDDGSETDWYHFGVTLAELHKKHQQQMFGFDLDNYIGLTAQPNEWHKKWDTFFAEQRIGFQLQLLAEKHVHLVDIDRFVDLIKQILHTHHCQPSLLHGDLWRGNVGFCQHKPSVFDPACYYGDREADIAMTELFGKFHHDFYVGYQDTYPLPETYQERKHIYNLYHVLNHGNIFGNQYIEDAHMQVVKIQQQYGLD